MLLSPLPSFLVGRFLGVPEADRARFDGWTEVIVAANASGDLGSAGSWPSATAPTTAWVRPSPASPVAWRWSACSIASPRYEVDVARARLAPGPFVRRHESLPFAAHA